MTCRVLAAASVLGVAVIASVAFPEVVRAATQSHGVAIANFRYVPEQIEIKPGDTVSWTNLDPTVHTVTASEGEFVSGSIHQGQTYSLKFNTPGVFAYFCEPHEQMRARIIVSGYPTSAQPATSLPPSPAVAPTKPPAPRAAVTAPAISAPTSTTGTLSATAVSGASGSPVVAAAPAASVTGGVLTGAHRGLPTASAGAAVILLALVGLLVLTTRGTSTTDAARVLVAGLTLATAAFHLQLHFVLHYPEPIGSLMIIEAGGATLLAAYFLTSEWSRTLFVTGVGFHVGSIVAFALSRTGVGLFGYHELGWDPSPQAAGAIAVEVAALALLLAAAASQQIRWRSAS